MKMSFTHDGVFKVDTAKISEQRVIQGISTPLSLIQVHSPTLEEAYVEIIKEQEENG